MTKLLLLLAVPFLATLAQAADFRLPVVLPPFGIKDSPAKPSDKPQWGPCLLYMEGLGITIFQEKSTPRAWGAVIGSDMNSKHTFTWDDKYVDCKNLTDKPKDKEKFASTRFAFTVSVKTGSEVKAIQGKDNTLFTIPTGTTFTFILKFQTLVSYGWELYEVENVEPISISGGKWISGDIKVEKGALSDNVTTPSLEIGTYNGYNYACTSTKAVRFQSGGKDDKIWKFGVFFQGFQLQPAGYSIGKDNKVHFSHNVHDCVGTFTNGSFMGIIVALILASVLIFGFLMLNSVQTVDRFDDPKQKQLIINAKE